MKANKKDDVQSLLTAKCDPNAHSDPFVSRPPPLASHYRSAAPANYGRPTSFQGRPFTYSSTRPCSRQTGDVCLHVAANKGRKELVELLLTSGAKVNQQNKVRCTHDPQPSGGSAPGAARFHRLGRTSSVGDGPSQPPPLRAPRCRRPQRPPARGQRSSFLDDPSCPPPFPLGSLARRLCTARRATARPPSSRRS